MIPEIAWMICEFLEVKDMVNLAHTCKMWKEMVPYPINIFKTEEYIFGQFLLGGHYDLIKKYYGMTHPTEDDLKCIIKMGCRVDVFKEIIHKWKIPHNVLNLLQWSYDNPEMFQYLYSQIPNAINILIRDCRVDLARKFELTAPQVVTTSLDSLQYEDIVWIMTNMNIEQINYDITNGANINTFKALVECGKFNFGSLKRITIEKFEILARCHALQIKKFLENLNSWDHNIITFCKHFIAHNPNMDLVLNLKYFPGIDIITLLDCRKVQLNASSDFINMALNHEDYRVLEIVFMYDLIQN